MLDTNKCLTKTNIESKSWKRKAYVQNQEAEETKGKGKYVQRAGPKVMQGTKTVLWVGLAAGQSREAVLWVYPNEERQFSE